MFRNNYGSILFSIRDVTTDGRQTDRQASVAYLAFKAGQQQAVYQRLLENKLCGYYKSDDTDAYAVV